MYIPKAYRKDDLSELHALMQTYSFATLVTQHEGVPYATHLPFTLRPEAGPYGTLMGHMARANPQWRDFDAHGEQDVLVMFQGPHAYVSPSWYTVQPSVPTWNYTAVHAYGVPRLIEDEVELYEALQLLVQTYEASQPQPWTLNGPDDFLRKMMRAIVGFSIPISRLEGKYKLSQNRSPEDQVQVVQRLTAQGEPLDTAVAALMQQQLPSGV
jgi:transcriptional regulator